MSSRIPRFRRDGDDLHLTVPIAIHEAALGARIDVPSVDGPVKLRVPQERSPARDSG
jgi:molecular chaperone DnaJ